MDDDGDVADRADQTAYNAKKTRWMGTYPPPTVSQVFSDVGNPYMFQGRPHFALAAGDWPPYPTAILLNDHRLRLSDPVTGRWLTRDPIGYDAGTMNLYEGLLSNPVGWLDPLGTTILMPPQSPGPTSKPDEKKCSEFADNVYGETGGMRPQFKDPKDPDKGYDPASEEDLHKGRKAVAEVAKNRKEAKRKDTTAEKTPTEEELKNPNVRREWEKSKRAAEEAERSPSLPKDAQHFYLRKGTERDSKGRYVKRPGWAGDSEPYLSFGPFRNLGGGDVGKGDDIYIDVYRGIK